jgi:hypothetical protein
VERTRARRQPNRERGTRGNAPPTIILSHPGRGGLDGEITIWNRVRDRNAGILPRSGGLPAESGLQAGPFRAGWRPRRAVFSLFFASGARFNGLFVLASAPCQPAYPVTDPLEPVPFALDLAECLGPCTMRASGAGMAHEKAGRNSNAAGQLIRRDRHQELGGCPTLLDCVNGGTYNYGGFNYVWHFLFDMLPYCRWENGPFWGP